MHPVVLDLSLAARNLSRHRRRTLISLSAIAFGVVALLIAGGFVGWILDEMRELTIRALVGHIQIARAGYRENGAADPHRYLVAKTPALIERLERRPGVVAVAPRLAFAGLASHGDVTLSFIAEAVDPDREARFGRSLVFLPGRGAPLSASDPRGIVVGQGLAANLGVKLGDTVVVLVNTPRGGVNAVETHVRGIFLTVNKGYDDSALRLPIATARELLRTTGTHVWLVLLDRTGDVEAVLSELRAQPEAERFEMLPWTVLADVYNQTVELFGTQLGFMKLMIGVLIVLGISNTMVLSVLERTGEIGTAMALGIPRRTILRQFVAEGAVLGVIGGGLGVGVGLTLAAFLSWVGIPMPPPPGLDTPIIAEIRVGPRLVVDVVVLAAVTATLASVYPAIKASRLVIVDALRQVRA